MNAPGLPDPYRFAELSPLGYLSPTISAECVFGVIPAILLAAMVLALVRGQRMRRRLLQMRDPAVAVVEGCVEPDGEATPPVQLKILQHLHRDVGSVRGNGWWEETQRAAAARSFYLRTASGRMVRVDPGDEPMLMIGLEPIAQASPGAFRTVAASLVPGLRIWAIGAQEKGFDPRGESEYRSSPAAAVLRPLPGEKMLIADEPPDRFFRARARFHFGWGLALVAVLALDQAWFTGYFDRMMHGYVERLPVKVARSWTTLSADGRAGEVHTVDHYAIQVVTSSGDIHDEKIGEDASTLLPEGAMAPFLVVPGSGISQFGERASVSFFSVLAGLLTALIAAIVFQVSSSVSRSWFERSRIDQRNTEPHPPTSTPGASTD